MKDKPIYEENSSKQDGSHGKGLHILKQVLRGKRTQVA